MPVSQANHPLKGLKVLVTRPAHQAESLCKKIIAAGGEVTLFSTLEIVDSVDKSALLQITKDLTNYDIAIFVSANAAAKTMPHLHAIPESLQIAAIGLGTTKALTQSQLPVDICPKHAFNSEGLLAEPALQNVAGKNVVIFSGEGGRTLLYETLTKRGARVTKIATYTRQKPEVDLQKLLPKWQQQGINYIVSTSGESLRNLYDLVGAKERNWLTNTPLVVISERMRIGAKKFGFIGPLILAENASDDAIVKALKQSSEIILAFPSQN